VNPTFDVITARRGCFNAAEAKGSKRNITLQDNTTIPTDCKYALEEMEEMWSAWEVSPSKDITLPDGS
jgi:hypothetical protein